MPEPKSVPIPEVRLCPVCEGRGEVEAGVTRKVSGPNWMGIKLFPNPNAQHRGNKYTRVGEIFFLEENKFVPLWGIAVCMICHGTGFIARERNVMLSVG